MDNGRYGRVYEDIITKAFLTEHYINHKLSPLVIAKQVGCDAHTIYSYIDYYKLPRYNLKGQLVANQIFTWLTTLTEIGKTKNGTTIWKCRCKCGKEVNVPTSRLKNGNTKSCGCYHRRKKNHRWTGYCDISGGMISEIRWRANKKKLKFNLDAKFLWYLFIQQDKKCAMSGLDIKLKENASLDRIDSSKGYTKDNVWWVHKDINKIKLNLPFDYFVYLCAVITNHQHKEKK